MFLFAAPISPIACSAEQLRTTPSLSFCYSIWTILHLYSRGRSLLANFSHFAGHSNLARPSSRPCNNVFTVENTSFWSSSPLLRHVIRHPTHPPERWFPDENRGEADDGPRFLRPVDGAHHPSGTLISMLIYDFIYPIYWMGFQFSSVSIIWFNRTKWKDR